MSKYDYTLGLYEKAVPTEFSWEERLRCAKECGFDYMELSIDESEERLSRLEWDSDDIRELRQAMKNAGISLESICLSAHRKYCFGSHDPALRERGLVIMQKAVNLARTLGIRTIQLAGYDVYYEESDDSTRSLFAENLALAVDMAAKGGVLLGFETMETPFMNTVEKAMEYVNLIHSPYLGVYPDTGNITNASFLYGKSVPDDVATGAGHIIAAHLKETAVGIYRELPFSTGTTDYDGALGEYVRQGVKRFVSEMWYVGQENWRDDVVFAAEFARGKIEAAFDRLEANAC